MWNLQPMLLNHCQFYLTKKTIIVPVWFYLHFITSIRFFQRPVRMKAHRTRTTRMVRDLKFKIKKMYPISQCALWRLISFLLRNRIIHEWFTNLNSNKEKIKKLSSISPKLKIVCQDDWEGNSFKTLLQAFTNFIFEFISFQFQNHLRNKRGYILLLC